MLLSGNLFKRVGGGGGGGCVFQAEDGIRDLVRSRGLGDVYKRQGVSRADGSTPARVRGIAPSAQYSLSFRHGSCFRWNLLNFSELLGDNGSVALTQQDLSLIHI